MDGGVINNEPFEYARFTLLKDLSQPNPREGDKADRAVVMIAPFPQPSDFLPDGKPREDLIGAVMALLPAMKNQARFKPSELVLAGSEDVFSRFMIAPHRTTPDNQEQLYSIASGLLGGFGGFLSRKFRDHDFQLGRRNCQKFLRGSFALPGTNPIIASWPHSVRDKAQFQAPGPRGSEPYFTIVPLVGDAAEEVPFPEWPRMRQSEFHQVEKRLRARIDKVVEVLITTKGPSWWIRRGLRLLYWIAKGKIFNFVRLKILEDLVRRNQIEGWDIPTGWHPSPDVQPEQIRMVWSELINPSFDLRNEAGLAATTHLDIGKVQAILRASEAQTGAPFEVWRAPVQDRLGSPLFTLASRKPPWYARLRGLHELSEWITPSKVDPPGL